MTEDINKFFDSRNKSSDRVFDGYLIKFNNFEDNWDFKVELEETWKQQGYPKIVAKVAYAAYADGYTVGISVDLDRKSKDPNIKIAVDLLAKYYSDGKQFTLGFFKSGKFYGVTGRKWKSTSSLPPYDVGQGPYLLEKEFPANQQVQLKNRQIANLASKPPASNPPASNPPPKGHQPTVQFPIWSPTKLNTEEPGEDQQQPAINQQPAAALRQPAAANQEPIIVDGRDNDNGDDNIDLDNQVEVEQPPAQPLNVVEEARNTPVYPQLLNQYGCFRRKLSPEKVAHALWLIGTSSQEGAQKAAIAKQQFSLWANNSRNLKFDMSEVDEYSRKTYEVYKC